MRQMVSKNYVLVVILALFLAACGQTTTSATATSVQAQLEQTALQYDTIEAVSIFVNGEPLETLLSGQ